ncbi:MAG: phosphate signaling complex protein PhoU [Magnetococcales bacterium]|nr:phosphate signaling complex protein PhoU [Magnetococcales bacterium]
MPIYEQKLQNDIAEIKKEVSKLGEMVIQALADSVSALFNGDDQLASLTVLRDFPINRQCLRLNKQCHTFIARHLPSAGHLRMVTSVIQMVMELERVGDYARTISREAIHMHHAPEGKVQHDLQKMAKHAQEILQLSMQAFASENVQLARSTHLASKQGGIDLELIFQDLIDSCDGGGGREMAIRLLDLQSIAYMLERVINRAANVCEEILFILAGEIVPTRRQEILFVDQDGTVLAPLAEAVARKGYGELAGFRSAGRTVTGTIGQPLADFMQNNGLTTHKVRPVNMEQILPDLEDVNIIISFQDVVKQSGWAIPFHTTVLEWQVGMPPSEGMEQAECMAQYEEIYRSLAGQLALLMGMLVGEAED